MDQVRSSINFNEQRSESSNLELVEAVSSNVLGQSSVNGENSVKVTFRNVGYSIDRGFFKKEKKSLLQDVSGDFYSSELTAIIGPSGAGKSTLMDILAGYTTSGVTGHVYINDKKRDRSWLRKRSSYIMQDDHLQPLLTVHEAMTVAANLKLSSYLNVKSKEKKVKEILESVDLWGQRMTRTAGLSGGQRKRLSIALELLTNPQIMFFDEPTSGLDIVSTKQCVLLLKQLASSNRTIICTIHQPSAVILGLFDHLYVVSSGACMYQGSVTELLPYLEEVKLKCPPFHNPSDFLLEVLSGDYGDYFEILQQKSKNGLSPKWRRQIEFSNCNDEYIRSYSKANEVINSNIKEPSRICTGSYSTSFPYQVSVLVRRTFKIISRDKTLTLNRLLTHVLIAMFIGILYYGIGVEANDMLNNFKFMFFSVMFLMLTSFNCVTTTFPSELPIVTREHFNKWYSLKSYYLAITLADIPVQIVATLLYGFLTYFLTRQPMETFRIISFLFMCVLISLVAQSFGLLIGACMDVKNGVIFGPFCMLPFTIFSGFFVQLNACHSAMKWLFHISFIKYGFEGMVLAVLGYNRPKLPCNGQYCHYRLPQKFLEFMDMDESSYSRALVFLVGLFLVIRIGAYFVLRVRVRKSRGNKRK
ncbi:ATP-binding cassette sub-family G member 1-like isoform X2 [Euwallacea fornicatus]|uniref:ATP-binding cassette sub-family G member 1-like isoform X2 n=1 Tax=Euwallacea fornicatus TaxID=995702 RepID=UPI00339047E0